ncbi:hypothetical protein GCM10023237_60860 [Streptomyces coeruleoprunus]
MWGGRPASAVSGGRVASMAYGTDGTVSEESAVGRGAGAPARWGTATGRARLCGGVGPVPDRPGAAGGLT